jgi:hypothetical protein
MRNFWRFFFKGCEKYNHKIVFQENRIFFAQNYAMKITELNIEYRGQLFKQVFVLRGKIKRRQLCA